MNLIKKYKLYKLRKQLYISRYNYRKYYHMISDRMKYSLEIDRLEYKIQELRGD